MAVVASLGGPVLSVPTLVALLVLYLGLLFVGALVPGWEMYGSVLSRGPRDRPWVALTFDDGPDPATTPRVLEALEAHRARATFFVIGEKAALYPELIRRMVAEGHSLGLHGFSHYRGYAFLTPRDVLEDIERSRNIVAGICGMRPLWFRPPIAQASPRTFAGVRLAQAEYVGYSVRPRDGRVSRTAGEVFEHVRSGLEPGAIVLLHDAWEKPGHSAEAPAGVRALPEILQELKRRGLRAVTLDELILGEEPLARHSTS